MVNLSKGIKGWGIIVLVMVVFIVGCSLNLGVMEEQVQLLVMENVIVGSGNLFELS